ncbi:hypothetical protein ACFL47_08395 [Candidatus Latescibacterota bacterium]
MIQKKFVNIGKGMYRATVRSKAKRERLAKIPEVQVKGTRVIFPRWLVVNIRQILYPLPKKKETTLEQTNLFPDSIPITEDSDETTQRP